MGGTGLEALLRMAAAWSGSTPKTCSIQVREARVSAKAPKLARLSKDSSQNRLRRWCVIRACLGKQSLTLADTPPSTDDWYATLLWIDRRKCRLITHADTRFMLLVADIRVSDLRPLGRRIVELLTRALLEEGVPSDALGRLEPNEVTLTKTASRHVLGVMNQMALEIGWQVEHVDGLWNIDIGELNRRLRRSLHRKVGDYRVPLEVSGTYKLYTGLAPEPDGSAIAATSTADELVNLASRKPPHVSREKVHRAGGASVRRLH
jgi:hypothetical protein